MGSSYGRLPLNALRVFEAVASRLSFAGAAEALSVTPAAVSQQIRSLEDYLQIPLLRRSGRRVELTPEGAALLPGIRQGLDTLVASLHQLQQMRASGNLSVSTLASLLQKWITPRLHRLHSASPELQVDWHTSRAVVDFTRSDFHAAIRFGGGHYPGLHSERLMDEWLVAVAAPAVLAKYGPLDPHKGLEGRPILLAKDETWAQWRGDQTDEDWPAGSATIDDSVSILVAAAEGLGFAVVRWSLAAPDIERGLISIASPHVFLYHWAYWLVCPEAYAVLPKFLAFRDWLRAEADGFKGPSTSVASPSRPGRSKASRKK